MKDLLGYMVNPFEAPQIGLDGLFAFTTDHFQRMKANNAGGWLDARIAATEATWDLFSQSESTDMGKVAIRKARKIGKRNFRKEMRGKLARLHGAMLGKFGAMLGKFGASAPQILEVFGQGRAKIARATDDNLEANLKAVATSMSVYTAELGAGVVADAQSLVTDWAVVYQASESATGAKKAAQADKRTARVALQVELFRNLLFVAQQFPGKPEKLKLYMQKSLLA